MIFSFPVLAIFSAALAISQGADELAFFYVDHASGAARGDEQIRLAAEERGNLQNVANFGGGADLRDVVNVA